MKEKEYNCPYEYAIDVVSGKWKGWIIWHLSSGTLRYGELKKVLPNITQKMLTKTLRELEYSGVVSRKVYSVVPPKVEYSLTVNGKKLVPILESLHTWGKETYIDFGKGISMVKQAPL